GCPFPRPNLRLNLSPCHHLFYGRWNGEATWNPNSRRGLYVHADAVCRRCSTTHLQGPFEKATADQFPAEPMVFRCLVVTFIDGLRDFRSSAALPRSDFLPGQARQLPVLAAYARAVRD